jgi:hypothetical protein
MPNTTANGLTIEYETTGDPADPAMLSGGSPPRRYQLETEFVAPWIRNEGS